MAWSDSAFVPASRALIFDTATAPMTTSARIIAPNAMPRRYARRRLLKRDIRFLPGKQVVQGAPAGRAGSFVACVIDRIGATFSAQDSFFRLIGPAWPREPLQPARERRRPRPEDPDGAAETTGGCRRF